MTKTSKMEFDWPAFMRATGVGVEALADTFGLSLPSMRGVVKSGKATRAQAWAAIGMKSEIEAAKRLDIALELVEPGDAPTILLLSVATGLPEEAIEAKLAPRAAQEKAAPEHEAEKPTPEPAPKDMAAHVAASVDAFLRSAGLGDAPAAAEAPAEIPLEDEFGPLVPEPPDTTLDEFAAWAAA